MNLVFVLLTVTAAGCGSTLGAGGSPGVGDASADGGPFCSLPVSDCTKFPAGYFGQGRVYCTLSEAIQGACNYCPAGAVVCGTGLIYGSTYTYVDTLNADVATRLVYDKTGALVAVLGYGNNAYWRCVEGPTDFDPSEATSTPSFGSSEGQPLRQICGGADAGGD